MSWVPRDGWVARQCRLAYNLVRVLMRLWEVDEKKVFKAPNIIICNYR